MPADIYASLPIMIVDDEPVILELLESILRQHGYENVVAIADPLVAREFFNNNNVAVAVLDLYMPGMGGQELLTHISVKTPKVPVIIVTADNHVETAIDCMRSGAVDYLVKPVSVPHLLASIASALEMYRLAGEILSAADRPPRALAMTGSILTNDQEMKSLLYYLEIVAGSGQPILISGETGTGKELFARAVHTLSGRSGQHVCINAAGLDDLMFTDTLFGHRKGAFTGAMDVRDGMVKKAGEGTLFLDEIGDLSESSQIKLLRLIQEGEYYPVGSDSVQTSRTRLVFATNRDLRALMDEKRFRKDLYYRLIAHQIYIPPLRDRHDDIQLLFDHFLIEAAAAMGRSCPVYGQDLLDLLLHYPFPGNVRELQALALDVVARTVGDRITLECAREIICRYAVSSLPGQGFVAANCSRDNDPAVIFETFPSLQEAEEELIKRALQLSGNSQGGAARLLGISRQALNRRLLYSRRSED